MKNWQIVLIFITFFIIPLIVFMAIFIPIIISGYEITNDAYHYTLSTIPQTIATLVGLFAIFSVYIIQEFKKRKTEHELKIYLKGVYTILGLLLFFGMITIIYSLCFLPFFQYLENPFGIITIALLLSIGVVSFIIIFLFFVYATEGF